MTMRDPWPTPDEAIALDVEDLAMRLLDRLASTPEPQRADLLARDHFINREVIEALTQTKRRLQPRGMLAVHSDEALAAFPELAQAIAEAWSYLESQAYLVPRPGQPGRVFISRLGFERHGTYRGSSSTNPTAMVPPAPASRRPAQDPLVPPAPTTPQSTTAHDGLSAAISWSHSDPGWNDAQRESWKQTVVTFAGLLVAHGVDVRLDLWRGDEPEDWGRFGSAAIRSSRFVLVIVSRGWRLAWNDEGDPTEGSGAVAEADMLHDMFRRDRLQFRRRVILVVLPGVSKDELPDGLGATTQWVSIPTVDEHGIEPLLRLLSGQGEHRRPTPGSMPHLPPRSGAEASGVEDQALNAERAQLEAELDRVTAALASLPQNPNQVRPHDVAAAREQLEHRETQTRQKIDHLLSDTGDPPQLQPHRHIGTGAFNLHLPAGPLNAHLFNTGGSAALVQSARLTTPLGEFDGQMWEQHGRTSDTLPSPTTRVAVDGHLVLQFGDEQLASLPQNGGELS